MRERAKLEHKNSEIDTPDLGASRENRLRLKECDPGDELEL